MDRRALLAAGPIAALLAACAHVDQISFDRGEFAITFTKLITVGLALIQNAINAHTKNGQKDAKAQDLDKFKDELLAVQAKVEKAIIEAPSQANQLNAAGLKDVVDILMKAAPILISILGAVA